MAKKKLKEIQAEELEQQKKEDFLSKFTQRKQNCTAVKQIYNESLLELDAFFSQKEWSSFKNFSSNLFSEDVFLSEEDVDANKEAFISEPNKSNTFSNLHDDEKRSFNNSLNFNQTNIIFQFVNQRTGNVSRLQPRPQVKAIHPEENKVVEKMQAILDQVWDQQDGNNHLTHQIWLSKWKPIAFTYLPWDGAIGSIPTNDINEPTTGDFKMVSLDAAHVWWDTTETKIQDMNYIILGWAMSEDSLKAYFRKDKEIRDKLSDSFFEEMNTTLVSDEDTGNIYPRPEQNTTQFERNYALNIYFQKNIEDDGTIRISCTYILNNNIILKEVENIGIKKFPLAALKEFNIPDSLYGVSTASLTLPAQRVLADTEKKIATLMKTKGKELVLLAGDLDINKDEVLDFLTSDESSAIGVQIVSTNSRANSALATKQTKINVGDGELQSLQNHQAVTIQLAKQQVGITEAYSATSVGSVQTTGGVTEMLGKASNIDSEATNNINSYLEDVFEIIVEYIQNNYSPRVFNFDTERTTAQGNRYPEEIFQDGQFNQPPAAPMGMMGGEEQMGQANPMQMLEQVLGGVDPMAQMDQALTPNTPPGLDLNQKDQFQAGQGMEGMEGMKGIQGMQGMPEMLGLGGQGGAPSPLEMPSGLTTPDRYKTLELKPGPGIQGDFLNEFSQSDFKVDVDIYNQTAAERNQNNQIMGQWIDRVTQQNNNIIPADLAKAYFEEIRLPNEFVLKASAALMKNEQEAKKKEQQAMAMQQQQTMMQQQQAQDSNQNQMMMELAKLAGNGGAPGATGAMGPGAMGPGAMGPGAGVNSPAPKSAPLPTKK